MNHTRIAPHINEELLDIIFNKYCYYNTFRTDSNGQKYILVPKELVLNDYYSNKANTYIKLSTRSRFKDDILYNVSGLTQQELFDLCVLHIKYVEDRPKCAYINCNKSLPWSGKYSFGYSTSSRNWNPIHSYYYCSRTCSGKDHYLSGDIGYGTLNNQTSSQLNQWLSLGSPVDECQFYIAITQDNKFKFGITSNGIHRSDTWNFYKNIKIIYTGTRLQVGYMEAHIKLYLNSHKESLSFKGLMSEFRSAYIYALKNRDVMPNLHK